LLAKQQKVNPTIIEIQYATFRTVYTIDYLSDRELLNQVFANQFHLHRKLDILEGRTTETPILSYNASLAEFIGKSSTFLDSINHYLAEDE